MTWSVLQVDKGGCLHSQVAQRRWLVTQGDLTYTSSKLGTLYSIFWEVEASQNNIVHLDMKNSVFIEDILVE